MGLCQLRHSPIFYSLAQITKAEFLPLGDFFLSQITQIAQIFCLSGISGNSGRFFSRYSHADNADCADFIL